MVKFALSLAPWNSTKALRRNDYLAVNENRIKTHQSSLESRETDHRGTRAQLDEHARAEELVDAVDYLDKPLMMLDASFQTLQKAIAHFVDLVRTEGNEASDLRVIALEERHFEISDGAHLRIPRARWTSAILKVRPENL